MDKFSKGEKIYIEKGEYCGNLGIIGGDKSVTNHYSVMIYNDGVNLPVVIHENFMLSIKEYLSSTTANLESLGVKFEIEKPLQYWEDSNFSLNMKTKEGDEVDVSSNYENLYRSKGYEEPIYIGVEEKNGHSAYASISVNQAKLIVDYLQKCVDYLEGNN